MEKKIFKIPFIILRQDVVFPKTIRDIRITDPISKTVVDEVLKLEENERLVFFALEKIYDVESSKRFFYGTGTVGKIIANQRNQDVYIIEVEGLFRALLLAPPVKSNAPIEVEVLFDEPLNPTPEDNLKIQNYVQRIKSLLIEIKTLTSKLPGFFEISLAIIDLNKIQSLTDLEVIVYDFISRTSILTVAEKQEVLSVNNLILRLAKIWNLLKSVFNLLKMQEEILNMIESKATKISQIGQVDQANNEYTRLNKKYRNIKNLISEEIDRVIQEDLERLRISRLDSAESAQIITHLEFLLNFPWGKYTNDPNDFIQVKQVLDSDHYGLEHVKERIIEFLAVKRLNPKSRGSIICFVGPAGVGKTSLGQSIARALNRKFIRISLGGIHDEAEIRGHRRTYVGALPGKILQEIKRCGSLNPVFMIDEIDKIGREIYRGDPSSALLEVLDPEQNFAFRDNYVGAGIDLSRVFFITTANVLNGIQTPLLDRMEIIKIPGYTELEKIQIAKHFLIPKQLRESGLGKINANFSDEILSLIIKSYTEEAGVRELERKIASIFRRIAKEILLNRLNRINIDEAFVEETLGSRIYNVNKTRETPVGVAIGLAVTSSGGCILFIESARFVSGQEKKLFQTGVLSDIFKESIEICLSLIRSRYFSNDSDLDKYVFHVHVPDGATPKDGPSAGITIFTSLYSLLFCQKVKRDLAMTGEINLEGMVLPVGGIREKLIAAERAGIKEVILPKDNDGDVANIPQEIKNRLKFHFVKNIDEVIKIAFDN